VSREWKNTAERPWSVFSLMDHRLLEPVSTTTNGQDLQDLQDLFPGFDLGKDSLQTLLQRILNPVNSHFGFAGSGVFEMASIYRLDRRSSAAVIRFLR
jgi:hypothetical protein